MYTLQPHPAARPNAISSVTFSLIWENVCSWAADFYVNETPTSLYLPEAQPPTRADGLWQTTCFELFFQKDGSEEYFELNFSPSGQWAAYRFDGYRRNGQPLEMDIPIIDGPDPAQVILAQTALWQRRGLEPDAIDRHLAFLSPQWNASLTSLRAVYEGEPFATGGPWWVGASAVIEEANGTKSYWALHHPSAKPDFHHPDSFVLEYP